MVEPDLSVPGYPRVFVAGDLARFTLQTGAPLPGTAPVAMQHPPPAHGDGWQRISPRQPPGFPVLFHMPEETTLRATVEWLDGLGGARRWAPRARALQ
jgi:hypothetical protein